MNGRGGCRGGLGRVGEEAQYEKHVQLDVFFHVAGQWRLQGKHGGEGIQLDTKMCPHMDVFSFLAVVGPFQYEECATAGTFFVLGAFFVNQPNMKNVLVVFFVFGYQGRAGQPSNMKNEPVGCVFCV